MNFCAKETAYLQTTYSYSTSFHTLSGSKFHRHHNMDNLNEEERCRLEDDLRAYLASVLAHYGTEHGLQMFVLARKFR